MNESLSYPISRGWAKIATIKDIHSFRQTLRRALDLLKEAGIITAWQIDPQSDLVTIERTPSESQQKHITQKASRKPRK
jgi:Fe2+ or Zn2+ uptake regulation protein